jgi:hypothetical protein
MSGEKDCCTFMNPLDWSEKRLRATLYKGNGGMNYETN